MTAPHPGRFRRVWLPLLIVAVPAAYRLALVAVEKTEVGMDHFFGLMMAFQFLTLAAVVALLIWFFALGGFARRTKLVGLGAVVGLAVGFAVAVERVEFDANMRPIVRVRWRPTAEDELARYRATAPKADSPPMNLMASKSDSPSFRGPRGDGTAVGVNLSDDWSATPPKVAWKHPVGGGHAGIVVAGFSVVTMEQRGGDEAVVCYDRMTGHEQWAYSYPAQFKQSEPMGGGGPRTTPAVADGMVYAFGATGHLTCVNGSSGKIVWQVDVTKQFDGRVPEWGYSGSPVVWNDRVIVNVGAESQGSFGHAVAAVDRATGKLVGGTGTARAAYASPMVVTLGGKEQVLVFDAAGLGGYDPNAGAELWRFPWKTPMDMNSAQPVVVGPDRVFVSSEKSNGGAVVEVTEKDGKWAAREVWKSRALAARFCSPVFASGHIFGLSDGRMVCVDAGTGKRAWADGDYGNGQIILAGDKLVVTTESGAVALVAADPAEHRELGRVPVFDTRTWNVPALAGRHLFLRNHREMACVELPTRE